MHDSICVCIYIYKHKSYEWVLSYLQWLVIGIPTSNCCPFGCVLCGGLSGGVFHQALSEYVAAVAGPDPTMSGGGAESQGRSQWAPNGRSIPMESQGYFDGLGMFGASGSP